MTQESTIEVIKLSVTPDQVECALPVDFIKNPSAGFSDETLAIPANVDAFNHEDRIIKYEISFDGEGELLGVVKSKPTGVSDEEASQALHDFFLSEDDEEVTEDEE